MISFTKLGNYGRLGNQLFQYAFLRVTAQRLKTQFFCPKWDGDDIFYLEDEGERVSTTSGIIHYFDSKPEAGFLPEALSIAEHTEIQGYFQSEKYYPDKQAVRNWYTFKEEIITEVKKLYGDILLSDCVSFSLRIDTDYNNIREYLPLYPISYYQKSLSVIKPKGYILVFADRPDLARDFFYPLRDYKMIFIDNLNAFQQMYLMTQCRANVITNSTFAWWGAWLNSHHEAVVVSPKYWNRPGVPNPIKDILCDDWVKIPGTRPILDNFQVWRIRHPLSTINRVSRRISKK